LDLVLLGGSLLLDALAAAAAQQQATTPWRWRLIVDCVVLNLKLLLL
jgi:hypothetical protein